MTRRRFVGAVAALAAVVSCAQLAAAPKTLTLSSARAFGPLRRSAVQFSHDLHSSLPGLGCVSCHHHGGEAQRSLECATCHTGKAGIRNAFHRLCIGCHDARARQGRATGPRTCGQCHPAGGPRRQQGE